MSTSPAATTAASSSTSPSAEGALTTPTAPVVVSPWPEEASGHHPRVGEVVLQCRKRCRVAQGSDGDGAAFVRTSSGVDGQRDATVEPSGEPSRGVASSRAIYPTYPNLCCTNGQPEGFIHSWSRRGRRAQVVALAQHRPQLTGAYRLASQCSGEGRRPPSVDRRTTRCAPAVDRKARGRRDLYAAGRRARRASRRSTWRPRRPWPR